MINNIMKNKRGYWTTHSKMASEIKIKGPPKKSMYVHKMPLWKAYFKQCKEKARNKIMLVVLSL